MTKEVLNSRKLLDCLVSSAKTFGKIVSVTAAQL